MRPLIEVKSLQKLFPVLKHLFGRAHDFVYAVDNLSFSVNKGETLGLAGESGCGKTTTGMLLVRLLESTQGSIYFKNDELAAAMGSDGSVKDGMVDIAHLTSTNLKTFRRHVQMIFQDPYESLNPRFAVFDTVAEPLIVHNLTENLEGNVSKALEEVELKPPEDFMFRFPHELSGGQRQRVAIARALVIKPSFVVADEPVSMLDVSLRTGVMNLMLDLREKFGLTYIFISHDLSVSRYMCDRIAIMYLGKIVEVGKTEDIIKNPQHVYTKALLSSVPVPDPRVKRKTMVVKEGVPTPINPSPGCRFRPRCPFATDLC
jgi:peptide/nickel transport system ATP-binding protein